MPPIDHIAEVLRRAFVQAIKDSEDELRHIAEAGGKAAAHDPLGDVGNIAQVLDLLLGVVSSLGPEAALPVSIINGAGSVGGKQARGYGMGYFLGYTLFQLAAPYMNYVTHAIADAAQSEIFDPATSARLVSRGIVPLDYGKSEAHGGGFDDPHFLKMIEDARAYPDTSTLMQLRNLDMLNDEQVTVALKRHGFADEWIRPLFALRRALLSPADLALAYLRGNIDKQTLDGYAKQLGVTPDDMQVLIDNTGEPPGPEQLMEAYRRGFIDEARFTRGIRQSRVRNEWIDVEMALRQSPMTTADAVRGVVESYLTDEQGKAIAEQNGLLPEHWRPLVESWGRPPSHEQMLQLYHRGKVTLDEVKQAFRESDLKNKYESAIIELGRRLVPERTIVSMIDHGVIAHDEGVRMLHEIGFNETDAERLVKLGSAQRKTTHKHMARGEVLTMYADRLVTQAEAEKRLVSLGYDAQDVHLELELADYKSKAAMRRAAQRGTEAMFKAHHLTDAQAVAQLVKDGFDAAQARALVDEWTQTRHAVTRTLTEAQVISLAGKGLIGADDARARLTALGLSTGDATLLLRLHGVVK